MDEATLSIYLRLFHSDNFSMPLLGVLLRKFGQLSSLLKETDEDLLSIGLVSKQILTLRSSEDNTIDRLIEQDLKWADATAHHIVCYESPFYPPLLKQIHAAPPLLYLIGKPEVLALQMVAIVGSRNATAYGERNAYWMARELGELGVGVCSGLARGIDAKAHLGALDSCGKTVSVMATGADRIYPSRNRSLAQKITEQGALLTEFPLGSEALPFHFPQRNRIISGLCAGTLVVEATEKSGSLITAKYALEQNREVFAIPGIVGTEQSKGCHRLIKQGAKLVERPTDVLEELELFCRANSLDSDREKSTNKNGKKYREKKEAKEAGKASWEKLESDKVDKNQERNVRKPSTEELILDAIEPQGSLLEGLKSYTGIEYAELIEHLVNSELRGKVVNKQGRYFKSDC